MMLEGGERQLNYRLSNALEKIPKERKVSSLQIVFIFVI